MMEYVVVAISLWTSVLAVGWILVDEFFSRSGVDGEFDGNDRKKMRRHCSVNWA